MDQKCKVRDLNEQDIDQLVHYWMDSDEAHLVAMGVDVDKMPQREDFEKMLQAQLITPIRGKRSYCVIWEYNGRAVGHSNTNPTNFGKDAYMHLHLWSHELRGKGLGERFVKLSLPWFFDNLQLEILWCQPYALNPAPNKTLEKAGFEFVKEYVTVPGSINHEQVVKLWAMSRERYDTIQPKELPK